MSRAVATLMGRETDSKGIEGARKRANTVSSAFGVSKRESHDSSRYYSGRMYNELLQETDTGKANPLPLDRENVIICADSRKIDIPDNCVHLMVTSPPYNAAKEYDDDLTLQEYLNLLREVFEEYAESESDLDETLFDAIFKNIRDFQWAIEEQFGF